MIVWAVVSAPPVYASAEQQDLAPEAIAAAVDALPRSTRDSILTRPNRFLKRITKVLREISSDDLATEEDFRRQTQIATARARASRVAAMMRGDINGDARVTAAEARGDQRFQRMLEAGADANGDGAVDLDEAIAHAHQMQAPQAPRRGPFDLSPFDVDRDGAVSLAEIQAVVQALAAATPQQTPAQRSAAQAQPQPQRPPRPPQGIESCHPPPRTEKGEIVLVNGYWGTGVSDMAVAGLDRFTSVATLVIEPGATPIYLYVSAFSPIVWRVTGAVERVTRMVVEPQKVRDGTGAAVLGLAAERVTFVSSGACIEYFMRPDHQRAARAAARLGWRLEADPADVRIVAMDRLDRVRLPSGRDAGRTPKSRGVVQGNRVVVTSGLLSGSLAVRGRRSEQAETKRLPNSRSVGDATRTQIPATRGSLSPQSDRWKTTGLGRLTARFGQFFPDGVVQVDPSAAVAPGPLEPYDVLPGNAGLIQLVKAGAIRETKPGIFLLTREIPRFPAELGGSPGRRMVIAKGVPVPAGNPGRLWVFLEETGKCILGC